MTEGNAKRRNRGGRKRVATVLLIGIAAICSGFSQMQSKVSDKDKLGMALDYFQSSKYHEALLLFKKLSRNYSLNPRFKAYMGVCFYYEPDYPNACKYFSEAIPKLESFAPHERSVYYYMAAQSFLHAEKYEKAIPLYEKALTVCYENEKGDALFGLASCYEHIDSTATATEYYISANAYYKRFNNIKDKQNNMTKIDSVFTAEGIEE